MIKLDEPFRNQEIFIISLFFISSDLGFRSEKVFFQFLVDFLHLDPDPWICIVLRIRIQAAKIIRIRILSTGLNDQIVSKTNPDTFICQSHNNNLTVSFFPYYH